MLCIYTYKVLTYRSRLASFWRARLASENQTAMGTNHYATAGSVYARRGQDGHSRPATVITFGTDVFLWGWSHQSRDLQLRLPQLLGDSRVLFNELFLAGQDVLTLIFKLGLKAGAQCFTKASLGVVHLSSIAACKALPDLASRGRAPSRSPSFRSESARAKCKNIPTGKKTQGPASAGAQIEAGYCSSDDEISLRPDPVQLPSRAKHRSACRH